jgi:DNA-binding protein H-NS
MIHPISKAVQDILDRAEILTVEEFLQLAGAFSHLAQKRDKERRELARAEIFRIAASVDMSVEELLAKEKPAKTVTKVAPRYFNPDNTNETWTGRGRAPLWAQRLKDAGQLDHYQVAGKDQAPQ